MGELSPLLTNTQASSLSLPFLDDFHVHLRQDELMELVVPTLSRGGWLAGMMTEKHYWGLHSYTDAGGAITSLVKERSHEITVLH